jgi:hypothetical protein
MPNFDYNPVPNVDIDKTNSSSWRAWFNNIYFNLSTKSHQTITAASPINLDARFVRLQSSGSGYAVTLAAPTIPGVYKVIQKTSNNADNITLAMTNLIGQPSGTTLTWNSQNDIVVLVSCDNSKWYIVSYNGVTFT